MPGYISSKNLKNAGNVFVVSVNDPFVYVQNSISVIGVLLISESSMKAWQESLDPDKKSGVGLRKVPSDPPNANEIQIRFLGDPLAEFTNALDLAFDATVSIFIY